MPSYVVGKTRGTSWYETTQIVHIHSAYSQTVHFFVFAPSYAGHIFFCRRALTIVCQTSYLGSYGEYLTWFVLATKVTRKKKWLIDQLYMRH